MSLLCEKDRENERENKCVREDTLGATSPSAKSPVPGPFGTGPDVGGRDTTERKGGRCCTRDGIESVGDGSAVIEVYGVIEMIKEGYEERKKVGLEMFRWARI